MRQHATEGWARILASVSAAPSVIVLTHADSSPWRGSTAVRAIYPTARKRVYVENKAPQPNRVQTYPTPPNLSDTASIAVAWSDWIRSSNAAAMQSSVKLNR